MRWFAVALCAGILLGTDGCNGKTVSGGSGGTGVLSFQKDTACADTTNTELFVDAVSQGQYTMRPGSTVGFTEPAGTHIAKATELAGLMRQFATQAVTVPPLGQGVYAMTCAFRPPPGTSPARPSPPGR